MRATVAGIEHRMNLQPLELTCDTCHDLYRTYDFHKWTMGPWREPMLERLKVALEEQGWAVTGNHERHTCPVCNRKEITNG